MKWAVEENYMKRELKVSENNQVVDTESEISEGPWKL
jgi:hypothetical protein